MSEVLCAILAPTDRTPKHGTFLFDRLLRGRFEPPALRAWVVHILLGRALSLGRSLGGGCLPGSTRPRW